MTPGAPVGAPPSSSPDDAAAALPRRALLAQEAAGRAAAARALPYFSIGRIFMTSLDYALTIGAFAALLLWLAWNERKADNARDAGLLLALGSIAGLSAGAVALFVPA